jgi:hypothetical protein
MRHGFAGWMVACFIRIVQGGVSLRGAGRMLGLIAELLGWEGPIPHWTTGRLWFLRWGLWQLQQAKEPAEDWAWLIDHSVQIGRTKCLVIVGLELKDLPAPGECLRHSDLKLIALEPTESSNQQQVQRQLESAAAVTGAPRVIVDDHGADLHGGVKLFQQEHPGTLEIYDTKHKAACLLKGRLEKDETWKRFGALVGQVRCGLQQTELACLVPPGPKLKARFMNLGAMLRWGCNALAVLRNPPAGLGEAGQQRLREKLGALEEFEGAMRQWKQWQEVVDVAVERVGRWGHYAGAAEDLRGELSGRLDRGLAEPGTRELAEELVRFVQEQSAQAADGQRLPGSTEVLESLFGRYKELEKQQSKGGFTSLLSGFGALVSGAVSQTVGEMIDPIRQVLEASRTRNVIDWCRQKLGTTVCSLRRQTFAAARAAQHKRDEGPG